MSTRPLLAACLIALAASCGADDDDGEVPVDAALAVDAARVDARVPDAAPPPPDADPDAPRLACLGDPPPTSAADPIRIEGTVFDASDGPSTLAGAPVEVRRRAGDALVATGTTDGDGAFSFEVPTGGAPLDVYLVVATGEHVPARAFPAYPLTADTDTVLAVVDAAGLAAWYDQAGVAADAADGTLLVFAADCDDAGVAGATHAAVPAADAVVYWDEDVQRWDPSLATSSNGWALLPNAPAGAVAVTAEHAGTEFPADTVPVAAGELTIAVTSPLD